MKNTFLIKRRTVIHFLISFVMFYIGCKTTQVQNEKPLESSIPEEAIRLCNEGVMLNFEKRYTDAIYNLTEAIKIAPLYQHAYLIRGTAFYALERYIEAMSDFDRAISLGPMNNSDFVLSHYMKGISYSVLGEYEMAIENYNNVLSITNRASDAYHERSFAYYHLEKMAEALVDVNLAIYIDRSNYKYFDTRGAIYFKMGHYNNALADFVESIRLNPIGLSAYLGRGVVYMALERYDEALYDLNKSLELDPECKDAYKTRSNLYIIMSELSDDTNERNEYLKKAMVDHE